MENFENIVKDKLSSLPHVARVVFAVACAERAQKIIDAYDDNPDVSQSVINSTWDFINGKEYADSQVADLKDYFLKNATDEEDMEDSIINCQSSVNEVISSIVDKTTSSSYGAAIFENLAIDCYDTGIEEEQQWQVALLTAIAEMSSQAQPNYREVVGMMNKEEPRWFQELVAL